METPEVQTESIEKDGNFLEITLKNIKYKYPQSEKYALNDVSFSFKAGERIAIDWEDCYETKDEWENDKREKEEQRKIWIEKVKSDLKSLFPNIYDGSCLIQKVNTEFFTVMHVYEITR